MENFLLAIGVSPEIARRDAEGMEHHVSEETLAMFLKFTQTQGSPGSMTLPFVQSLLRDRFLHLLLIIACVLSAIDAVCPGKLAGGH